MRVVDFPADLLLPFSLVPPPALFGILLAPVLRLPLLGSDKDMPSVGVLRASGVFVVKVWELSSNNSEWGPVSQVRIKKPAPKDTEWVYFLSFHPEDNDILFLCRDFDVCSHRLSTGKYTRVFTLLCPKGDEDPSFRRWLLLLALTLPVRLPLWPTPMPALPSSQV